MCVILEGVIKEERILNMVCNLATAGRTFMYCWCHDGYNLWMKPKSLYYHNGIWEKRLNFWLFYIYVSNKKPQWTHKVQKMVKKLASARRQIRKQFTKYKAKCLVQSYQPETCKLVFVTLFLSGDVNHCTLCRCAAP